MSTTLRQLTLTVYRRLGIEHFRAKSSVDRPFICHIGDSSGEMPFYNREMAQAELVLMAEWCAHYEHPLIFDIGGNVGFIATQLAQLLLERQPRIFSFEPVPHTLLLLVKSVQLLQLEDYVFPVGSGVGETPQLTEISYSEWNTMFAQIASNGISNQRVGDKVGWCGILTLDQIAASIGESPCLIKLDVEGSEVRALKGAQSLMASENPPAIAFEFNPATLSELGSSSDELLGLFQGYQLYYVGDFENQKFEFGREITCKTQLDQVCNLFAVPAKAKTLAHWRAVLLKARAQLALLQRKHLAHRHA
ncbi:MAG TPA: FkbM family methyltransferase [Anaerolineales bacterium]|nr:FkbM family methyltransferase [Anaerolineales bacterium]